MKRRIALSIAIGALVSGMVVPGDGAESLERRSCR
jgi:hypothetical protein